VRQIPGLPLWLGHVGDARNLRIVTSAGIVALVDLAANEPPVPITRELVYCRFPILDGAGNPPWLVRVAVGTVAGLLQAGTPTMVFCSAGMSRSLVIAGAAVALLRGVSLAEGVASVSQTGPADVSPGLLSDVQAVLARPCVSTSH
jgi:protein-tyrosine phosphatase